jgi:uncharacterized protein YdeI (YjbR/CyaY-like superfamily)
METRNPKVDFFFSKAGKWQKEFKKLRAIILDCGLTEELKWGKPCYTLRGSNIVLMHGFNEYCALLFMKGALLPDRKHILVQQTEHVQAARQIRFRNAGEVDALAASIKTYVRQAIKVEKAGLQVQMKKTEEFCVPEEFQMELKSNPDLKTAFAALTPGRQRGYLLYFSAPKQAKTRVARVEKCIPQILKGKGLNDQ